MVAVDGGGDGGGGGGGGGDVRSEAAAVAAALAAAGVPATAAQVKVPDVPRGGTVAVVLAAVSSRRGNPEVAGSNPGGGVRAGALKSAVEDAGGAYAGTTTGTGVEASGGRIASRRTSPETTVQTTTR